MLEKLLKAGIPILVKGNAGTGKSSVLRQIAADNNRTPADLRVAMMPPEDIVGIPRVKKDCFTYYAPEWAAQAAHNKGADILIILEEIHLAPPAMHAALYQLLQEKSVAGIDLSNSWIAATANPPEQAGAAFMADMPDALLDRLEIFNFNDTRASEQWLKNLADKLCIPKAVQNACGLDGLGLSMTPRACERLLRLIAAGITDEALIARRAGNATSAVLAALKPQSGVEIDILSKISNKKRASKNALFTREGFLDVD